MTETTGTPTYDTSEQNDRYISIQTNPEDDAIQIHTDEEMNGENIEPIIRRSPSGKPKCKQTELTR